MSESMLPDPGMVGDRAANPHETPKRSNDFTQWMAEHFIREDNGERLRIKPIPYDVVLTQDQALQLRHDLSLKFCGNCNGTGFDPDTLNGKCEYCGDMPF